MKTLFYAAVLSLAALVSCAQRQAADEIRLRATVRDVAMRLNPASDVIPVDADPRFALTVAIETAEPAVGKIKAGEVVTFAIHSPALLFRGDVPKGKTCQFSLRHKVADTETRFHGLAIRGLRGCR